MGNGKPPAATLQSANKKLLALRTQARQARLVAGHPVDLAATHSSKTQPRCAAAYTNSHSQLPSISLQNAQELLLHYRQRDRVAIKQVAGGKEQVASGRRQVAGSTHRRSPTTDCGTRITDHRLPITDYRSPITGHRPPTTDHSHTIRHYPSIGVAALEKGRAATYRVWLACRSLDGVGRGWLPEQTVRQQLTGDGSPMRLFGWRRLRQILREGNGRFWSWGKDGRLWLHGAARVAAALGVSRLSGRPVAFPVAVITAGIGDFKAHLYAAWHSGQREPNPVTRRVQETLTGVPARTQRHYCRVAGVTRTENYAVGARYNHATMQERAWRQGRGVFEFVDYQGQQGARNGRYVAWQLPSSHSGIHRQCSRGRQRKVNRQLADLVTDGAQGNGQAAITRIFHADGAAAGRTYNQEPAQDVYWPGMKTQLRQTLWHCLEKRI